MVTSYKQGLAPHIRTERSVPSILWLTALALTPVLGAAVAANAWNSLRLIGVAVSASLVSEVLARTARGKNISLKSGDAVLTGLLVALMLPASAPSWAAALTSAIAVILIKEMFGGPGAYPLHAAVAGRVLMQVSFPLAIEGGAIGFGSPVGLFLGAGILVGFRLIRWEVPVIFLGVYALLSTDIGGGALFAAFFLITDPVTTPQTRRGLRFFAMGTAVMAVLLGEVMRHSDGIFMAVLVMNGLTPWFDQIVRPRNAKVL
ncbi:MAG: RnfABCDGE type electron transport complex subunit D [Candidatus Omnitrophota bacterium]|nr:RnfABCDGE type electron transport complex subunit D [Candidatus Omnitrophota bacterium]